MKWNAATYNSNAGFVSRYGEDVLRLVDPKLGEAVLDLGCGEGALAEKMATLGCSVTAIDASPEMVAAARARGLDAHVISGEAMDYAQAFDAVFSNAALHWMKQSPEKVIANVHTALRPGGRFGGEMGGRGNVRRIRAAICDELAATHGLDAADFDPWFFPDAGAYRGLLEAAGFRVTHIELFPRPTPLPSDMAGWLEVFARPFLAAIPAKSRDDFIGAVMERLRDELCDSDGQWSADYVRLRFLAWKD